MNYKDVKNVIINMLKDAAIEKSKFEKLAENFYNEKINLYRVKNKTEMAIFANMRFYCGMFKGFDNLLEYLEREEEKEKTRITKEIERCLKTNDFVEINIDDDPPEL